MLDSILLIGKNNRDNWLDMFTKSIDTENREENILVNIIFDLDNGKVEFDPKKLDSQVAIEYRYINKTFWAPRIPVPRLTFESDEFKKRIRKKFKKRSENVKDLDKILDNMVDEIIEEMIEEIIKQVNNMKGRLKGDLKGVKDLSSQELGELCTLLNEVKDNINRTKEQIRKEYARIKTEMNDYNIECFTISIKKNGHIRELAKDDLYIKFLKTYIKYPNELREGSCHICNTKKVLTDPAFENGSLLKIYNVDKKGFISGISDKEQFKMRTFAICPECRLNLIIGNKYIYKKLSTPLYKDMNLYVIPRISFVEYDKQLIGKLVKIIRGVTSYEGFAELHNMLEGLDELFQEWYTFIIIFGSKNQAAFNLECFVQEVPITNIRKIYQTMRVITNKATEYWGSEKRKWDLTLSGIANLFQNGKEIEKRELIELLSSILQLHYYPINKLFELAILWAHITHYNSGTLKKKNSELEKGLIKFNYILLLLKELGMVDKTNSTNTNGSENITINDERIKEWVKSMQYNDLQTGLFILGHLISQIGNAQYKKGDEKKSILNKIDFKGMKALKILILANEIPYHLRNYRILNKYNESNYCHMMKLLNNNRDRLDEDPIGNLFYILSGYAYGTYTIITASNRTDAG